MFKPKITSNGIDNLHLPKITLNNLKPLERCFNYYNKTSIVFIIEELWAWLKVTPFALIAGSSPFWPFYAPEIRNASETNKIVQAQKWSKRGTKPADCTKDGLVLPVMVFVNRLFGNVICENI